MKKNNRVIVYLSIILFVLMGIAIGFNSYLDSNKNTEKYTLKKYADLDFKVSQVLFFETFEDYVVFDVLDNESVYSSETLFIYKNGKEIYRTPKNTMGINKVEGENIYYTSNNLINYRDINKPMDSYDSLELHNEVFIVSKREKYGLIDREGNKVVEPIYDKIISRDITSKYLFAIKDEKVGVIDIEGNIIIPIEYKIKELKYYDYKYTYYGEIIEDNNRSYFILEKDNLNYVFDENYNLILEKNNTIYYDYKLDYFYTENNNIYNFYALDGSFIKNININSNITLQSLSYISNVSINGKHDLVIFKDPNNESTIYELTDDLELNTYTDIYYDEYPGMEDEVNVYYITKEIYVKKINDKYVIYSKNDNKKIAEYLDLKYVNLNYSEYKDSKNLFIACKNNKECGLLDIEGNPTTEFKYEYNMNSNYPNNFYGTLNNGNDYIVISANEQLETLTCKEGKKLDSNVFNVYKNAVKIEQDIYAEDCEKMNEKPLRNFQYLENNYIVAEIDEECTFDIEQKCNYYIWDNKNNLIKYENKDNATIYTFLGYSNNKLFFKTNKGIYYIETK